MGAAFCPNCGLALPPVAAFCPRCGTARAGPVPARPSAAASSAVALPSGPPVAWHLPPPPPPGPPLPWSVVPPRGTHFVPPARPDHTARIAVVVLFVVVLLLVVGLLAPLPHSFHLTIGSATLAPGVATLPATGGSTVTGSFSVSSGDFVHFQVADASHRSVYNTTAPSGSFSFQATDAPYVVSFASPTPEIVQVSGIYFAPYL
jgi:hypothetical protein